MFPLSPIILSVSAQKSARFRILRGENCRVIFPWKWRVLRFRRNSWERNRRFPVRASACAGLGNVETTKLQLGWFYSTFRRGHAVFTVLGIYDALNYPVCNKTRGGTRMTPRWTNKREITVKPGSPLRGYLSFSIVRHGYSGALRETRRKRTVKTVGCLAGWMFPGSLPDRLKRGDRCLIRCFACKGKTGRPGWRMRLIIIFTRFVALRL